MIKNYFLRHAQVFFYSLGQLARAPLAHLMTVSVIGITLALPSALYVTLDNVQRLSQGWEDTGQISLFLKQEISESGAEKLADKIRRLPSVAKVEYLSRETALAEFKRLSGFGEALNALDRNPLPAVLVVRPSAAHNRPEMLAPLLKGLSRYHEVELAQLDLEWVRKLHALLALAKQGILILAGLLALAVLLIIGNTIRLSVLNHREEIEVTKLVGGTNAFIRRPFLYSGFIQGLLGAALAWLLVGLSLVLLAQPIHDLSSLYGSRYQVESLNLFSSSILVGTGGLLGWLGARLAVGRHLRAIEPR